MDVAMSVVGATMTFGLMVELASPHVLTPSRNGTRLFGDQFAGQPIKIR